MSIFRIWTMIVIARKWKSPTSETPGIHFFPYTHNECSKNCVVMVWWAGNVPTNFYLPPINHIYFSSLYQELGIIPFYSVGRIFWELHMIYYYVAFFYSYAPNSSKTLLIYFISHVRKVLGINNLCIFMHSK